MDALDTESDARYRGLLEAAPDAMVVVDESGAIVLLNLQAEKQFGYQRDELVGQPVTNIIPEGFAERLIADDLRPAAEALAQQIGTGIELTARRKDGSEFPIEIMLSPLDSADGILVTAAIRDLSVRKAAENQLLQAQKLESIGRLAGGIAHDFNNMLFVIHGYAELLAQDLAPENRARLDPDRALASVKAVSDAATRAARLTAQLLAFSRKQVVTMKVLDLNAAVTAIGPMLNQLIGSNVTLVRKLDPATGHIRADVGQLDQIIVNLVVNARDAMAAGGTITIETRNVDIGAAETRDIGATPGGYVHLVVRDDGVGMDHATRSRIFEPFFTTKDVGHGTGLGLATTQGIVHHAGGHITIDSELGHGSAFHLYFPRIDAPVEVRPRVNVAARAGSGRILVIDDEVEVRTMTKQLLERVGFAVTAVADGHEAIAAAAESEFDGLVSDIVMPRMSGVEVAEWMMARYPAMGVVLLSGYTPETFDLDRIAAAGALFVSKPVSAEGLIRSVVESIDLRSSSPVFEPPSEPVVV